MPLTVRSSPRRRRKNLDEKLSEQPGECTSAQAMAPTRMKLRVRRRDNAAAGAGTSAGSSHPDQEERHQDSGGRSSRRRNTGNILTTAAATSSSSPPTSSASARAVVTAEETSPDSKCPICLDRFNNLAYLDRCLHRFCFPCIQEWSHNKAECPLCKQPFTSILHSVRAEDDFKEYTLRPAPASNSIAATVAMVAAMASAARSDHQMRLTLRRHRAEDSGETNTRRRRRERGGRGIGNRSAGERIGGLEWFLDSHLLPLPHLPHHPAISPVITEDSDEAEELTQQRMTGPADLEERGVIFEGLTGLGGAVVPVAPNDRALRRLMIRLAARQRLQREGGTVRRLREREMVTFRRALYRCGIWVRGIAGVNGNQGQQQSDITAESFRQNPAQLNRLRPWLRRELTVLYGAHGMLVDIVQRIITARLARHGLEDTPTIEEELRPFLLARTDHFLHELISFARSPLTLDNYDLQAVYEPLATALELDGMSTSDSSSVIAISEGEEEERQAEIRSEERLQAAGSVNDNVIQPGSCLSLSGWDDETPGPSYSTAEPSCSLAPLSFSPAPQEAANEEGAEKQEGEEECQIVGYKKPIAERTPELVQLSSDTEEGEEEKKKEEEKAEKLPPIPSNTPGHSFQPTIPPSTSGTYREEPDERLKEKHGEAGGRGSRARSWSDSSGRSRESVFTLSPSERQRENWTDRKQSGSEVVREKRRRRNRRRRGRERSSDWLKKSGTMYNPNRTIYPAMLRHCSHSPSPFHSSIESCSPLPHSPPNSSWEYHCSPLTSSGSSPSFSSPEPLPPTPSLSPSSRSIPQHGEKPSGKRKYKSRHLDSNDKDPTWRPSSSHHTDKRRRKGEKERRRGDRDGVKRRDRPRRDAHRDNESSSSRRCREDRSPSVEIIYEGTISSDTTHTPAHKRHRKRHRTTQHNSSPVIITLDSDSSHDEVNNNSMNSSSSSPLSSQQTVDFSDLPPLPLVHSSGVGGTLDSEIGELPADILDRGSDGSETEPVGKPLAAGPITVDNSDTSDVDVENVEERGSLLGRDDVDKGLFSNTHRPNTELDMKPATSDNRREAATVDGGSQPTGGSAGDSEVSTSDSRLLQTILHDLKGIGAPQCDLSLNCVRACSPDTRRKRFRDPCEVSRMHSNEDGWSAKTRHSNLSLPEERQPKDVTGQNQGLDLLTCQTISPPTPKECGVCEEGVGVPPLPKRASPVQTNNRKLPLLKHKDDEGPHQHPVSPVDLHSPHASDTDPGGANSPAGLNSNPVDPQLAELPKDNKATPPISALKRYFTSSLALTGAKVPADIHHSCRLSPTGSHSDAPSEVGALTTGVHSTRHNPLDSRSSLSENSPTGADCLPRSGRFHCSELHSDHDSTKKASPGPRSSSASVHPVNSLCSVDLHSSKSGCSTEKPPHMDSTSRGCRNKTLSPETSGVIPTELHPCSHGSAVGMPPGSGVFSGVSSNNISPPALGSSRAQSPRSPSKRDHLSVRASSAPSDRVSPPNEHPRSLTSAPDLLSSSAASGLANSKAPSAVSHEDCSPRGHPPPTDLHDSPVPPVQLPPSSCTNATVDGHFNHTASPPPEHTAAFHTPHRRCSSQPEPTGEPPSKRFHPTDSEPHKHFAPSSTPQFPIGSCSEHSLPTDSQGKSQPPLDFHPKPPQKDFQIHRDNHVTPFPRSVENRWSSNSSGDTCTGSQPPDDERSASAVWTHALSRRTHK